jgi:hypothetical protein
MKHSPLKKQIPFTPPYQNQSEKRFIKSDFLKELARISSPVRYALNRIFQKIHRTS